MEYEWIWKGLFPFKKRKTHSYKKETTLKIDVSDVEDVALILVILWGKIQGKNVLKSKSESFESDRRSAETIERSTVFTYDFPEGNLLKALRQSLSTMLANLQEEELYNYRVGLYDRYFAAVPAGGVVSFSGE